MLLPFVLPAPEDVEFVRADTLPVRTGRRAPLLEDVFAEASNEARNSAFVLLSRSFFKNPSTKS